VSAKAVTIDGIRAKCPTCITAGWPHPPACVYCDAMLATRHEHDHMPVPKRARGEVSVPVCLNCHDLKDRSDVRDWDADRFQAELASAPPLARILIALLLAELHAQEGSA
jgi:hypothetical protein